MLNQRDTLGWGNERQVADFFGLTLNEVRQLADSGQWPFVTIHGTRLFDVDELLHILVQQHGGGGSHAT